MVLAVNTDLDNSLKLAEQFRVLIENYDFGLGISVTVSIGVATIENGQNKEELIAQGDNALYRAKESGRNRICY